MIILKEMIPFNKKDDIRVVGNIPYIKEGNTIRPLKYEIGKNNKESIGYLYINIKTIEENNNYTIKGKEKQ